MRGVLAFLVLLGCSNPARSPHGNGNPDSRAPDAGAPVAATDAAPAPVTEAECDTLIDHVLDLTESQTYDELPAAEREAARADAKQTLREEFLPSCLAADRAQFECLLAAPDTAAFKACGG